MEITQRRGIVVGCPRSGTTFLSRLLNAAPGVESMIGTLYPVALPHLANHVDDRTRRVLAIALERSIDEYLHSGRCWSRAMSIQKWFNAPTGIGGLARALRGQREIDIFVYKEPMLSFAPELVSDAFPDGKILHIIRDGRDAANSMVRTYGSFTEERLVPSPINVYGPLGRTIDGRTVPWWVEEADDELFLASPPFVRSIMMWRFVVQKCIKHFANPAVAESGNVITVRYEDLMRDPESEGRRILTHFGIEPTGSLRKHLSGAHQSSIGNYRRRPPAEIEAAERVAGELLTELGYTQ